MKRAKYDKRMNPWDNWVFSVWRPFLCWAKGHDITCYGITPSRGVISGYLYICHRCVEMTDHEIPCGQCTNACIKEEEDYGKEAEEGFESSE